MRRGASVKHKSRVFVSRGCHNFPEYSSPSLSFSLSEVPPFTAANLREDIRRCAKQDFPSCLKEHHPPTKPRTLVTRPADPRRPIKSSDGDRTFKTDRSSYVALLLLRGIPGEFHGTTEIGKKEEEKEGGCPKRRRAAPRGSRLLLLRYIDFRISWEPPRLWLVRKSTGMDTGSDRLYVDRYRTYICCMLYKVYAWDSIYCIYVQQIILENSKND